MSFDKFKKEYIPLVKNFDCGNVVINNFLNSENALDFNQGITYVLLSDDKDFIIGVGDEFHVQYRAAVITLSDTASKGEREDASGAAVEEIVGKEGYEVVFKKIIPDDGDTLTALLCELSDEDKADLILTTGGTGFSKRDNTPEATMRAVERETPGISEAMRYYSLQITPRAMLSRGVSGIRKEALIVNLPGSPKAVRECLEYAIGALTHGIDILKGNTGNCAGK